MRKPLSLFFLLIFITLACREGLDDRHAQLRGSVADLPGEWIYLEELRIRDRVVLDSTQAGKDGSFSFYIDIHSPGFYLLRTKTAFPLTLILNPNDDVHIMSSRTLNPDSTQITGSHSLSLLVEFMSRRKQDEARIDSLTKTFVDASGTENFLEIKHRLDASYADIFTRHKAWVEQLIMENDTSILSLFLLNQRLGRELLFPEEASLPLFEHLDSILSSRYTSNLHVEDHQARVVVLKRRLYDYQRAIAQLQPGLPAPGFILQNPEGKPVSLDTLKGQRLLLYFWSAECGRCRIINQQWAERLKSMPGIRLITISMDVHKQVWEGAIRLDNLPGLHLSDLMGANSPMQDLYLPGRDLPYFYLLDEEGHLLGSASTLEDLRAETEHVN